MPKFLAPGVFIKETSFRRKSIEGVSTSVAGFIGPCRSGPVGGELTLLTGFSDFERIYGTSDPLEFGDIRGLVHNYMAHAVRAFFSEGGESCYVARIVNSPSDKSDDGNQPGPADYEGTETVIGGVRVKTGLRSFEDLEDISIVAAPGATFDFADVGGKTHAEAITRSLISHCEKMRYRIAVVDSVNGHDFGKVRAYRNTFDSSYAALYYPWITTFDPLTRRKVDVPPSGSVCGIYARVDNQRGVHKAPANQEIRLASGLEIDIDRKQQSLLNPQGINCLRYFGKRGYRVWGARTATGNQEWKYVSVRRHSMYLVRSMYRGTQWAVFEPNTTRLWNTVRQSIEAFLSTEWKKGALAGVKPEEAYYVRCDRSTMTQNDIDNGRLICEIGIAPVRPAEFIVLHLSQRTANN